MTRHTEHFKLLVIEDYLSNTAGFMAVGNRHGIEASTVRRWVAAYRVHGEASVKKKRSRYSAQYKLAVLKHMRKHALSYRQTEAYFDIRSAGIIGRWERQYDAGGIQALSDCPQKCLKKMQDPTHPPHQPENDERRPREQWLKELNYLRMENAYLKKLSALIQADQQAIHRNKRKSSLN